MKVTQIIFVTLMFVLFGANSAKAEYNGPNFLEIMADARKGGEGVQYVIFFLENEINQGRTDFKKLESNKQEFAEIKKAGCLSTATNLQSEIRESTMPVTLISQLSNSLIECGLSYKEADINPEEMNLFEKKGLAILAIEAFQDYKATKNEVSLSQYKKYMRWGELKLSDLPLTIEEISIITSMK
jgi:hypothetical protein